MLKAGIIGLGHGSRVLIDAFRLNNIKIYGIASKTYSKAINISKEKKIHKTFRTWKDLVNDNQIDIVAIAVPPYLQIEILKECLLRNKKVLCEKPLGIDFKKINNLILDIKKKQNFFFIDYIFPEHQAFKKFKKILIEKKINQNIDINISFNTKTYANKNKIINWKSQINKGGGIINLYLSHIVDYLIWFFGSIKNIKCNIIKKERREISAYCIIEFSSCAIARIVVNLNKPKKHHIIKVNSKKFNLILENFGPDYGKNFAIKYKKINNNKNNFINIPCNDLTRKFQGDTRILLTSRIIKKIKNGVSNTYKRKNLNRFHYNEYILHYLRKSVKEDKKITIK